MLLVGLTGGIAAGKTTVAGRLRERGAVVIDADEIAREVVEPGSPVLERLVERFGDEILAPDGSLDRQRLADKAFGDPESLKDLNAITHPAIGAEIARRIQAQRGTDNVVIVDAALLVETGRAGFDKLVVVAARPETQLQRVVDLRQMDRDEAERRIKAQAPLDEKVARADIVIWNEGTMEDLLAESDRVWEQLQAEARSRGVATTEGEND
jgi:dephospho-CoA kinase